MRTLFQLFLALLTLSALAWVVWQGYLLLNREQLGLSDATRSLLVMVAVLAVVCTFMVTSSIRSGAKAVAQGQLLHRKMELYEGFISIWHTLLKESDPEHKTRIEIQMDELKSCLTLQASQRVLQAINELLQIIKSEGVPTPAAQKAFEKLLLEMRSDLGLSGTISVQKELNTLFASSKT